MSVAEVKTMIRGAQESIEEGQEAIHTAARKFSDARMAVMSATKGTKSEDIGAGHAALASTIGELEEAAMLAQAASEKYSAYLAAL